MPDLSGRNALVTGASRGIGAAIARVLDRRGARVALVGRQQSTLEAVAADLRQPVVLPADLADAEAPPSVVAAALDSLGHLDILVNNAAIGIRSPIAELGPAQLDHLLAVNVRAPLLLIAAVSPGMVATGRGSIINITSVSGLVGTPRRAAYAASKGALDAATRSLAMELGPAGIRVNAVAPGVVDTAMWERNKAIPGVIEAIEAQTPLRRWSTPEDVADVVAFLASDDARFVTGETISADGGMARTLDLYAGPV